MPAKEILPKMSYLKRHEIIKAKVYLNRHRKFILVCRRITQQRAWTQPLTSKIVDHFSSCRSKAQTKVVAFLRRFILRVRIASDEVASKNVGVFHSKASCVVIFVCFQMSTCTPWSTHPPLQSVRPWKLRNFTRHIVPFTQVKLPRGENWMRDTAGSNPDQITHITVFYYDFIF